MFLLTLPSKNDVDAFLVAQQQSTLSYSQVDLSQSLTAPAGFVSDHNRVKLGAGQDAFLKAQAAVRAWKMFDIEWLRLCWPETPIIVGQMVGVLVHHFGIWSLNACRVVYLVDVHAGASLESVMAISGHHAKTMVMRYSHSTEKTRRAAISALDGYGVHFVSTKTAESADAVDSVSVAAERTAKKTA